VGLNRTGRTWAGAVSPQSHPMACVIQTSFSLQGALSAAEGQTPWTPNNLDAK